MRKIGVHAEGGAVHDGDAFASPGGSVAKSSLSRESVAIRGAPADRAGAARIDVERALRSVAAQARRLVQQVDHEVPPLA